LNGVREKYTDGHAVMGDLTRKREKDKEIITKQFDGVVGKNLWQ
jgi:hypothetical protein